MFIETKHLSYLFDYGLFTFDYVFQTFASKVFFIKIMLIFKIVTTPRFTLASVTYN